MQHTINGGIEMNKLFIAVALILAIVIMSYFSFLNSGEEVSPESTPSEIEIATSTEADPSVEEATASIESSSAQEINLNDTDVPNLSQQVSSDEKPLVGYQAPSFSLIDYRTGEVYELHQSDKPVVLNFWASWCGPCHAEAPELVALNEKYGDKVNLYAINLSQTDQADAMDAFVQDYNFSFPVLTDDDGSISNTFQILAVPTTIFINADGIIEHIVRGYQEAPEGEIGELEYHYQQLHEGINPS